MLLLNFTKRLFFFKSALLVVLSLSKVYTHSTDIRHGSQIFVNWCVYESTDIFPKIRFNVFLPPSTSPYVILSTCRINNLQELIDKDTYAEISNSKHLSQFSPHSFLITIKDVSTEREAKVFRYFYERMTISSMKRKLIKFNVDNFHFFQHQQAKNDKLFIMEFLRSRWNLDKFIISTNASGALDLLSYMDQYPTSIQKNYENFKTSNFSDVKKIFYNIYSGYLNTCKHNSIYEKLRSLTFNFNAYDRLFCDAFERYDVERKVEVYYNLHDLWYTRGSLIRDGILSSAQPDASNALYYASPARTFVVLKKTPITYIYIIRPFHTFVWIFLLMLCLALLLVHHLRLLMNWIFLENHIEWKTIQLFKDSNISINRSTAETFTTHESVFEHYLALVTGLFRVLVTSAYGGMILVGILNPVYFWTPDTFRDLNETKNYYIAVAQHSPPFLLEPLRYGLTLSGIEPENFIERQKETPTDYLSYATSMSKSGSGMGYRDITMKKEEIELN